MIGMEDVGDDRKEVGQKAREEKGEAVMASEASRGVIEIDRRQGRRKERQWWHRRRRGV
ncbi:hypothetical protein COCNU_scaffold163293G000010 [Cocos nucifera]|nr:hypothetical protein [Cocos nucifera]